MAKRKGEKRQEATGIPQSSTEGSTSAVIFPNLLPKIGLECRVTLEDQIFMLDVTIQYFLSVSLGTLEPYSHWML
jgi:hypothetical protein